MFKLILVFVVTAVTSGLAQQGVGFSCPWKKLVTTEDNLMQCGDGTFCSMVNAEGALTNTHCCNDKGMRAVCPQNYPVWCATLKCANGQDWCCEASVDACQTLYSVGERPCNS